MELELGTHGLDSIVETIVGLSKSGERAILNGKELHRRVHKSKWCITRADLRDFHRLVQLAINSETIQRTSADDFDPADYLVGPNMYTVNEQFIKPETRKAGDMSWALMLHPDGLQCDLFITHAWQEGVFELLTKVVYSWPNRAENAYCCVFSNPQNLDISDLVKSPGDSPFALALRSSRAMLVVPNQQCSIYTRLWCAYEAFLAYETDKDIWTAKSSNAPEILSSVAVVLVVMLCGALLAWVDFLVVERIVHEHLMNVETRAIAIHSNVVHYLTYACLFGSFSISHTQIRSHFNKLGSASVACTLVYAFEWTMEGRLDAITDTETLFISYLSEQIGVSYMIGKSRIGSVFLQVLSVIYFTLAQADIVRKEARKHEAAMLLHGFGGTVEKASCSVPGDQSTIFQEIGDRIEDVDKTIALLIQTGMSTKALRSARTAGVEIKRMMFFEYAAVAWSCGLPLFAAYCLFVSGDETNPLTFCAMLSFLFMGIAWAGVLMHLRKDGRAFAVGVLKKYLACIVAFSFILLPFRQRVARSLLALLGVGIFMVPLPFAVLGLDRLVQVPVVGRPLAQILVDGIEDNLHKLVPSFFNPYAVVRRLTQRRGQGRALAQRRMTQIAEMTGEYEDRVQTSQRGSHKESLRGSASAWPVRDSLRDQNSNGSKRDHDEILQESRRLYLHGGAHRQC